MAHDLEINHIISKVSKKDTISIGTDSIIDGDKVIYNISVIARHDGNKACTIWTIDIEDDNKDPVYRDVKELTLLFDIYNLLYNHIKENKIIMSVGIHKKWFNRFKYELRERILEVNGL